MHLLCKRWIVAYMLVDANKIQVMPAPNPDRSKVSTDLNRPKQSTNYI
jgi:hypothetical protein